MLDINDIWCLLSDSIQDDEGLKHSEKKRCALAAEYFLSLPDV